ncbi:hypothetical protein AVEN_136440-1 [Araneus ventricosus]|uniref:Uncharacterized protein n=1 Tax=Araneus ventricosus TaxID=182803 RepID=A0A4Y2JHI2_ARAVE|nr:hypothetical protein AVEN_136440-1 [Araneus ventricosus]
MRFSNELLSEVRLNPEGFPPSEKQMRARFPTKSSTKATYLHILELPQIFTSCATEVLMINLTNRRFFLIILTACSEATRPFWDGPPHFELWSTDEDDT